MVLLRSRVLCRVHDGFWYELRRILRITTKCIFMRSLDLESSIQRTVLHSQQYLCSSENLSFSCQYCTQLWQHLSTSQSHKYALYANIFFLISGHCEWRAALRVNRKAKPPQAVGLFQPMFSQHMHHIKTQDLYFLSDSAFKEPFPKMWPWLLLTMEWVVTSMSMRNVEYVKSYRGDISLDSITTSKRV